MRDKVFDKLTALVFGSPWLVIIAAVLMVGISGAVSTNLKMETRILDMLPRDDPTAIEYDNILREYSSASQVMIGVEGGSLDDKTVYIDALEKRIKEATFTSRKDGTKKKYIQRITVRADTDFLKKHALMIQKESDLQNTAELFENLEMADLLMAYNDFLEREYIEDSGSVTEREKEDGAISSLKGIIQWLEGVKKVGGDAKQLEGHADYTTDLITTGNPYMLSEDDSMLIAMAVPTVSIDDLDETLEGAAGLRKIANEVSADFPNLTVRLAGMPMLSLEEMESVEQDGFVSSAICLFLVLALFVLAFRMWTAPILAVINLVVGIVLTTGFIALTFGRLNMMTAMFGVIILGLGIDFAIHLNAAFATARSEGKNVRESLASMYKRSGSGVITGALTTAAAFAALALTGLDALVELGVVLSAGILLTLLTSLTLLPAMYVIHERISKRIRKGKVRPPKPVRLAFPFLEAMGKGMIKLPWIFVGVMIVLTGGALWISRGAEFQRDMLEMEPEGIPSVTLHRDIIKKFELSPDFTMVTSKNLDETRTIAKKMKKNRLVGRVDAITEFLPSPKEHKNRARIAQKIQERMRKYLEPSLVVGLPGAAAIGELPSYEYEDKVSDEQSQIFLEELERFQMNVQEISQMAFTSVKKRLQRACDQLSGGEDKSKSRILALKNSLAGDEELRSKLAEYQRAYIPLLAEKIEGMANTEPITMESLPDTIKERYMSSEGSNLVTIYASVDVWQEDKMELFNDATSKVSDRVTGTVVLMDRLIELIGAKGLQATYMALAAVFLILLIDFRHLGYALLGIVPLLTGFAWMMGLFVLLGYKFDASNITAIPLILGIGIDDAVHLLHALKRNGTLSLPYILKHTGRALILTSLTTGIAFGAIGFSTHRGLAGMGVLLVLGVGACLVTSIVLLPALARIFFKDKQSKEMKQEVGNEN